MRSSHVVALIALACGCTGTPTPRAIAVPATGNTAADANSSLTMTSRITRDRRPAIDYPPGFLPPPEHRYLDPLSAEERQLRREAVRALDERRNKDARAALSALLRPHPFNVGVRALASTYSAASESHAPVMPERVGDAVERSLDAMDAAAYEDARKLVHGQYLEHQENPVLAGLLKPLDEAVPFPANANGPAGFAHHVRSAAAVAPRPPLRRVKASTARGRDSEWFDGNGLVWPQSLGLGRQPSDVVAGRLLFWIRGDQGVLGMMSGPTLVLVDALGAPLAALSLLNRPVTWANALADVFYVHYTLDDGPIEASRGAITATDAHTGRLYWELDAELCTTADFAIAEDRLLCGHAEPNGTAPSIVAVDLRTGAELSRTPLDSPARILLVRERELFVRTVNTDYVFDLRS